MNSFNGKQAEIPDKLAAPLVPCDASTRFAERLIDTGSQPIEPRKEMTSPDAAPPAVSDVNQPRAPLSESVAESSLLSAALPPSRDNFAGIAGEVAILPSERRSHLDMTLLWVTMTASFPTVLAGYGWYRAGISLPQVIGYSAVACAMLMLYSVPASYIGSKTGMSYATLTRSVFGARLARLVMINNIWVMLAWYALCALFVVDAVQSVVPLPLAAPIACIFAGLLMAVNNFFGFRGIADFARFVAAPALIIWILIAFSKSVSHFASALLISGTAAPALAFSTVCNFSTGYAVWGVEPEFWRHGPDKSLSAFWPILVALCIGELVFPITGWLCAWSCQLNSSAAFTHYMYQFTFGSFALLVLAVLLPSYFAVNDSNLFGMLGSIDLFRPGNRRLRVAVIAVIGSAIAFCLSQFGGLAAALESVASLNGVLLPSATTIMIVELLAFRNIAGKQAHIAHEGRLQVKDFQWPGLIALLSGYAVGVLTSGVIPGLQAWHVGICTVQAWFSAAVVYYVLRRLALAQRA